MPNNLPLPAFIRPMLAKPGRPFDSQEHLFEVKWDGIRATVYIERDGYRIMSRQRQVMTDQFPELEFLAHLGLGARGVTFVGIIQLAGGVLLVPPKTRFSGAILAVVALIISGLALFTAGNVAVGLITLFPIAIGVSVITENLGKDG